MLLSQKEDTQPQRQYQVPNRLPRFCRTKPCPEDTGHPKHEGIFQYRVENRRRDDPGKKTAQQSTKRKPQIKLGEVLNRWSRLCEGAMTYQGDEKKSTEMQHHVEQQRTGHKRQQQPAQARYARVAVGLIGWAACRARR